MEPLHNLQLGISKLQKEYTIEFLGSNRVMAKLSRIVERIQPLDKMRGSFLRGVNFLLTTIEWEAIFPGLHVNFSCKVYSLQLSGLFLNSGLYGMH